MTQERQSSMQEPCGQSIKEQLVEKVQMLTQQRLAVQHTMDEISELLKACPSLRQEMGLRCVIDNQGFTVALNNEMPKGCRPGIEYY